MNRPMTLQEIADIEGISPQSVANILENAMKKIRRALKNKGYQKEDFV